jgi:hypothetical protein
MTLIKAFEGRGKYWYANLKALLIMSL